MNLKLQLRELAARSQRVVEFSVRVDKHLFRAKLRQLVNKARLYGRTPQNLGELKEGWGQYSAMKARAFEALRARLHEFEGDSLLKRIGVSGYNKPKRTPNHPTKSHVVVAKEGDQIKTIRFGQQGVSGSPRRKGESASWRKRRESFKARHAKNIAKGKMSAAHWSDQVKW